MAGSSASTARSRRDRPIRAAGSSPSFITPCDMAVKRPASFTSQYQSADNSVSALNRASRWRSSAVRSATWRSSDSASRRISAAARSLRRRCTRCRYSSTDSSVPSTIARPAAHQGLVRFRRSMNCGRGWMSSTQSRPKAATAICRRTRGDMSTSPSAVRKPAVVTKGGRSASPVMSRMLKAMSGSTLARSARTASIISGA